MLPGPKAAVHLHWLVLFPSYLAPLSYLAGCKFGGGLPKELLLATSGEQLAKQHQMTHRNAGSTHLRNALYAGSQGGRTLHDLGALHLQLSDQLGDAEESVFFQSQL